MTSSPGEEYHEGCSRSEHSVWAFRKRKCARYGHRRRKGQRNGASARMQALFGFQNNSSYILKGMRQEYGIWGRAIKEVLNFKRTAGASVENQSNQRAVRL